MKASLLALVCSTLFLAGCFPAVLAGATAVTSVLNGVSTGYSIQEKRLHIKEMQQDFDEQEKKKQPKPAPVPKTDEKVKPAVTYL